MKGAYKMEIKRAGYDECYKRVEAARTATPVNTKELNNIRDTFGADLYRECLNDVIKKYNLE